MSNIVGKTFLNKRSLVYGKGINDFKESVSYNKVKIKEYTLWKDMLKRCYCEKYHIKQPSYKDCRVDEYFHSFTNFYNFIHNMKGFNEPNFCLDKDIIFKGNKIYSPDTIVFVPSQINNMYVNAKRIRGDNPIGVHYCNRDKKYISKLKIDSKNVCLGYYNTPVEAFNVYKEAKEQQAKVLAERWKDKIDERAYNALMNYKVEITD